MLVLTGSVDAPLPSVDSWTALTQLYLNQISTSLFTPTTSSTRIPDFQSILKLKYIDSGIKRDNNKYNQKLLHVYVMTKWMANN